MLSISYFQTFLGGLLVIHNFLPAEPASCPKGWLSYFSNCYGLFPERMTRKEAKEECRSVGQGGQLASILTDPELAMVTRYITTQFKGVGNIWIGLKDRWKIRTWKWDDGSKTGDLYWTSGVPRIFTRSKYCTYMMEQEVLPLKMPATAAGETSGTTLPRPRPYNPEDPLQPMFSGRESLRQYIYIILSLLEEGQDKIRHRAKLQVRPDTGYEKWKDADCSEKYAFLCKMKS